MTTKEQRYKERLRAKGLIPASLWILPQDKAAVMTYDRRKDLKVDNQALKQHKQAKAQSKRIDEGNNGS